MELIPRHLRARVAEALDAFRVVVVHGPRQCGKTTLVHSIAQERGGSYVSLDDSGMRDAAMDDPLAFLTERPYPLVVDEVQLGGDRVVRTIKQLVDMDPSRGRFLLAGSSNFLTVPTISESLAGRVRILCLWPLSEAELAGTASPLIDGWFDDPPGFTESVPLDRLAYFERLCRGGYPDVAALAPRLRPGWFRDYVETLTQRDLAALADIRRVAELPRLLRWVASASGSEVNISSAARSLELKSGTVNRYLEWLRTVFLVREIPAWSRSYLARAARRPKLHLTDTGVAAALLGVSAEALTSPNASRSGPLLESFVVNEILRQADAAGRPFDLYHCREHNRYEVDLVLERPDGSVIAVEVKATSSPQSSHVGALKRLRDKMDAVEPGAFRAGYLLHTGSHVLTMGDRLHLRPISALWTPPDSLQLSISDSA